MNMQRRADVTALVGSRICHDLISPLGAIGNGVELLELAGHARSPEMALIAESVEAATARIRFFRVAYGAAAPDQRMSRAEIAATLSAAARGGRISYFWSAEEDQPRAEVRAVFLLLQCCEAAMPFGGDIRVDRPGATWQITAESDRLQVDMPLWAHLSDDRVTPRVSANQVQFLLLPEVLGDLGRRIGLRMDPDRIVVTF